MGARVLLLFFGIAAAIAGCGSSASTSTIRGSAASCVALTQSQQFAAARVVFVGRFLAGETAGVGGRNILVSPARMRVGRYLKGHGPGIVRVDTAISARGAMDEDGIEPQAGEAWRIYATSRRQPYATSLCIGSKRIGPQPA
jgi:hypothetical protein